MKNLIFFFIAALFFGASVNAQSTVDSIEAKYKLQPMPDALTIEKTFPVLGTYQLGATTADAAQGTIVISLDSANKGIVWIDGLPEGRMKAYLKKAPATYRIVPQKTESGKQIPEGTLVFDPSSNTLNIALGKPFDEMDPASVFNFNTPANNDVATTTGSNQVKVKSKKGASKTKTKLLFYTATKAMASTSLSNPQQ